YIIPRGEGTEDDIKFNVSAGNARTPFILNYTDSLFFVPNMNYYDDYFQLYFAISNLTHFRFEYYISENDDDNACTMEVSMYSRGSDPKHTFIENTSTLKKGAGSYEWTRPDNVDPSIKAGLIFLMFDHFEGDPTFRFVKIEFDTSC
ncbi:MAG: hypothetical protein K6B65_00975, partial [Bacilli bacterium]|nr:hypothetical protein [Bacilli bacterium]